jgi:4-amino-4-deoxy-L-arabinose transferase-like glycosyltransferase
VVLGVPWFLFFHRLAERDLWSSHEARAGQNAASILRSGEWGRPTLFDGQPELQKPPLYYWLVALAAKAQGGSVDAFAVRLPAAVSALATVLAACIFLGMRGRWVAGAVAALVLATTVHYTWMARVGRIDMVLTLAVGLALGCFYQAREALGSRLLLYLIGYLAIAAALLLKGPIGLILPLAVLAVCVLLEKGWRPVLRSLLWGVPLVLGLTVPVYLWINAETDGQFFRVFFLHHNLERGLGNAEDLRVHPWWFYGPRGLVDFLPWSPLVLLAGWCVVRRGARCLDGQARFGLVWLVTMLLVLSCAGFKRADYLLPAYPGAALLLGCMAERWYAATRHPRKQAAGFVLLIAGCVAGWWIVVDQVLPAAEPQREMRSFAQEIRRLVPPSRPVLFFRAEAHVLSFHLRPWLDTFLEWENLDIWAGRRDTNYIVMPPECAAEWPNHVSSGRLVEVLRNTDLAGGRHELPLVLMRTEPLGTRREPGRTTMQRQ